MKHKILLSLIKSGLETLTFRDNEIKKKIDNHDNH